MIVILWNQWDFASQLLIEQLNGNIAGLLVRFNEETSQYKLIPFDGTITEGFTHQALENCEVGGTAMLYIKGSVSYYFEG